MARYTGPRTRIARKFGEAIFGADKVLSKKNYPPGQHGNSRKRKTSEYGIQLREKQKAKYTYWRSNLETYSKKLHALKVLPVRCFFNC
jgi:small subunit ribosomal protein S4